MLLHTVATIRIHISYTLNTCVFEDVGKRIGCVHPAHTRASDETPSAQTTPSIHAQISTLDHQVAINDTRACVGNKYFFGSMVAISSKSKEKQEKKLDEAT